MCTIAHAPSLRQRTLKLAFLFPGPNDPWLNRVVAGISQHPRTFSNLEYRLVSLNVSNIEYLAAYSFCQQAVQANLQFTDLGMLGSYFQPKGWPLLCYRDSQDTGCTFCSKIVTEALRSAGVPEVESLHPCTTTPSMLLEAVVDSPRRVVDSVQYRRQQLFEVGVVCANGMRFLP